MPADDEGVGPSWYPTSDFHKYADDERWAACIGRIQTRLQCESWQAWLVFCAMIQTNIMAEDVIAMREEQEQERPWEIREDDDD